MWNWYHRALNDDDREWESWQVLRDNNIVDNLMCMTEWHRHTALGPAHFYHITDTTRQMLRTAWNFTCGDLFHILLIPFHVFISYPFNPVSCILNYVLMFLCLVFFLHRIASACIVSHIFILNYGYIEYQRLREHGLLNSYYFFISNG